MLCATAPRKVARTSARAPAGVEINNFTAYQTGTTADAPNAPPSGSTSGEATVPPKAENGAANRGVFTGWRCV